MERRGRGPAPLTRRVLEYLDGRVEPISVGAICEGTGMAYKSVANICYRLSRDGKLIRTEEIQSFDVGPHGGRLVIKKHYFMLTSMAPPEWARYCCEGALHGIEGTHDDLCRLVRA